MKLVTFAILLTGTLAAMLGTNSSMRRGKWTTCRTACSGQEAETRAAGCADTCPVPQWLSLQYSPG